MANRVDDYNTEPFTRLRRAVERAKKELGPFSLNVEFMGREGRAIKRVLGKSDVQCEELCKEGVAHHVLNYIWQRYRSAYEEDIYLFLLEAYEKKDLLGVSIILNEDGTVAINNGSVGSIQKAARQKIHVITWEEKDFAESILLISMLEDIIQNIGTSSCAFYLEKLKEANERLKRKVDQNKIEAREFIEGGLRLIETKRNWPAALFKLRAAADRLERRKEIIEGKIIPKFERERRAILYYLLKSMEADYLALKALEIMETEALQKARNALLFLGEGYGRKVSNMLSRILELKEYGDEQLSSLIAPEARAIVSAHLELLLKE
jgi:hypothetical protein